MEKFSRRLVKVLPEHNQQCQELLRLMGVPFIVVGAVTARLLNAASHFALFGVLVTTFVP